MEEEPKKVSQNQTISENDKSSNDRDSSKGNASETSSFKHPSRRFRDFLARGKLEESESPSHKVSSETKVSPRTYEAKNKGTDDGEKIENTGSTETHEIHFSQELMKFDIYRKLRSNKEKVIKITGGIIGVIFIIAGILYIMGSAFRVADNVIFGERAVLSAFLILVGILIIAGIFARSLLEGSFLKNIHSELEEAEEPSSNGKSSNKKEKQKGNIGEKDKK